MSSTDDNGASNPDETFAAPPTIRLSEKSGFAETLDLASVDAPFGPRYQVLSQLGEGAMGTVYEVRDVELDEVVALKALKPQLVETPRAAICFRREVKLARRVTHRNVARIFDFSIVDGQPFLTMELIDGRSLREILDEKRALAWEEALRYVVEICEGLHAAHRADVFHRDLKPDNVMVRGDGSIAVTDFGIAVGRSDPQDPGAIVGTPHYLAPEQARGAGVDERSDLYALGCMLFEMLSGTLPWRGETLMQVVMKRLLEPPPVLPPEVDVPEKLRALVSRCMAREREDRPPSAQWVAEALINLEEPSALAQRHEQEVETPTNLTVRPSRFVGRGLERAALAERFSESDQRIVSLLGPGGTGKTRLSQEYGLEHLDDFPGGVWFCDLSTARTRDEACAIVAQVLSVPWSPGDRLERLANAIEARGQMLLILDNLEQVVSPAAELLERWVGQATQAKFLATSRVRLGVEGEYVMPIAALDTDDALELFEARARQVRPGFHVSAANRATLVEIIERVDALPLAVELAAGQMRIMAPDALLQRLDDRFRALRSSRRDRPRRHLTLRGVLDDSWELLSLPARRALAQLSVFRGGATLDAACGVIELDGLDDPPWPEEAIEELWDHSLLRWSRHDSGDRLVLLESVREYAATKLEDVESAQRRHAQFFAGFGDETRLEAYHGEDGKQWLAKLCVERDNVLVACRRSIEAGDATTATRAALAAHEIFSIQGGTDPQYARAISQMPGLTGRDRIISLRLSGEAENQLGRPDEAKSALEEAARLAGESGLRGELARVELAKAANDAIRGDFEASRDACQRAFDLFGQLGDRRHQGRAAAQLGRALWNRGELEDALVWQRKALVLLRDSGDRRGVADALMGIGLVEADRGQIEEAKAAYLEALALVRQLGARLPEGLLLTNLASVHVALGEFEDARRLWQEAIELHRNTGDERSTALVRLNLGATQVDHGEVPEGLAHLERALATFRQLGERRFEGIVLGSLGVAHGALGSYEQAERELERGEVILRDVGDRFGLARLLCKRAQVDLSLDRPEAARTRLDAARAIRHELGAGPRSLLSTLLDATQDALRDHESSSA